MPLKVNICPAAYCASKDEAGLSHNEQTLSRFWTNEGQPIAGTCYPTGVHSSSGTLDKGLESNDQESIIMQIRGELPLRKVVLKDQF